MRAVDSFQYKLVSQFKYKSGKKENFPSVIWEGDTPELTIAVHILWLEEFVHKFLKTHQPHKHFSVLLLKADYSLSALIEQNLKERCGAVKC